MSKQEKQQAIFCYVLAITIATGFVYMIVYHSHILGLVALWSFGAVMAVAVIVNLAGFLRYVIFKPSK